MLSKIVHLQQLYKQQLNLTVTHPALPQKELEEEVKRCIAIFQNDGFVHALSNSWILPSDDPHVRQCQPSTRDDDDKM
jgi:hypothetical protein